MHNYHDSQGRFPPAVVYGKDDKPLLRCRVLLLPYEEQANLYAKFKLDEQWDSPHKIQLLSKMPRVFEPPGSKKRLVPPYHTVFHVYVGKGAPFEGKTGLRMPDDFPDGTSNTIL